MLSMVAGDAVDDALLEKLRALTSEHSIARAILGLQVGYLLGRRFLLYFTLPNKRRAHLRALTHSIAHAILGLQVRVLFY